MAGWVQEVIDDSVRGCSSRYLERGSCEAPCKETFLGLNDPSIALFCVRYSGRWWQLHSKQSGWKKIICTHFYLGFQPGVRAETALIALVGDLYCVRDRRRVTPLLLDLSIGTFWITLCPGNKVWSTGLIPDGDLFLTTMTVML